MRDIFSHLIKEKVKSRKREKPKRNEMRKTQITLTCKRHPISITIKINFLNLSSTKSDLSMKFFCWRFFLLAFFPIDKHESEFHRFCLGICSQWRKMSELFVLNVRSWLWFLLLSSAFSLLFLLLSKEAKGKANDEWSSKELRRRTKEKFEKMRMRDERMDRVNSIVNNPPKSSISFLEDEA